VGAVNLPPEPAGKAAPTKAADGGAEKTASNPGLPDAIAAGPTEKSTKPAANLTDPAKCMPGKPDKGLVALLRPSKSKFALGEPVEVELRLIKLGNQGPPNLAIDTRLERTLTFHVAEVGDSPPPLLLVRQPTDLGQALALGPPRRQHVALQDLEEPVVVDLALLPLLRAIVVSLGQSFVRPESLAQQVPAGGAVRRQRGEGPVAEVRRPGDEAEVQEGEQEQARQDDDYAHPVTCRGGREVWRHVRRGRRIRGSTVSHREASWDTRLCPARTRKEQYECRGTVSDSTSGPRDLH
jgi:hypothetical protein